MLQKWKKNKILRNAVKQASEPVWFVYYESNNANGSVKVFANTEAQARERAAFIISDILNGDSFIISGTAAIQY